MAKKKQLGVGATVSILLKCLHPKDKVQQAWPVIAAQERQDFIVLSQKDTTRKGKSYVSVVVDHPMRSNYRGQITVPRRFVKVKMEGVPNMFFDSPQVPPLTQNNPSETAVDTTEEEQDPASNICRDLAEDIALIRNQGYDVDDDNKPAPENVPNADATFNFGLYPDQQWGESMFVNPMANTGYESPPGFVDFDINNATYLEIFFKFFPFKWLI